MSHATDDLPTESGHFCMESGLHADTWINLDALFLDPRAMAPRVEALARLIAPHDVSAVCGPLLGGAFVAQALATELGLRFYVAERVDHAARSEFFGARYRLPEGQRSLARAERFAIVDDVISAGSSVRATAEDIAGLGATVSVVGTLLCLGTRAISHFQALGVPVVHVASRPFSMWEPENCPQCRAGLPLTRI